MYARDTARLRAEGQLAARVLELPGDANTKPLPDGVPGARSEQVEGHVKDALRGILGIPLNGSQPWWTNCNACFQTYRTQDEIRHECAGEMFKACRVCGCLLVRGDNNQVRRHHISKCPQWHAIVHRGWHAEWLDREGLLAARDMQFFDRAACRVAVAEAAGDETVLRTALLRELKDKEVSKIQKRISATNPFSGIWPRVLSVETVEAMRAEIRRENASSSE